MPPRRCRLWVRAVALAAPVVAATVVAGCRPVPVAGIGRVAVPLSSGSAPPPSPAPPLRPALLHGGAARAAGAVAALSRALRNGDVEALCRPGSIFTQAVVAEMNGGGESCEASTEGSAAIARPPAMTVVALSLRRDLAVARVAATHGTVPVDLVRDGRRWIVSFSGGDDPLGARAG